ncbi:MAG TPA: hypothetical protein VIV40_14180 [Kofleriaceae bacterium]
MRCGRIAILCSLLAGTATYAEHADTSREPLRSQRKLELGTYEGVTWPIVNAPIDGPLPPAPKTTEAVPEAPQRAGQRVLEIVDEIQDTLRESSYQAHTVVRPKDGVYDWDCSGMAAWILRRAAPTALRQLKSSRPVARDFVNAIEHAPTKGARNGWQRIARIDDVMPGDVFAWRRPRGLPSKNTGHVGFVVDRPLRVPEIPNAWAVRIADSTRGSHQDDARASDDDGGFGIGTLLFLADDKGNVTQYGWSGTVSEWYIVTPIVFGRVHR